MLQSLKDFQQSVRALARRPAFALTSMATLALAIGANALIFSAVEAVLLRPLPYGEDDRLVTVASQWVNFPKTWVSADEYALYRDQVESFAAVGAFTGASLTLGSAGSLGNGGVGDRPERVDSAGVSPNLLKVLGLAPALGRSFSPEEAAAQADVVMLSHEIWSRRYGADPAVVGSTVEVDGTAMAVVGILPAGLVLPQELAAGSRSHVWWPLPEPAPFEGMTANGGSHGLLAVARLAPGVSLEKARAELLTLNQQFTREGAYPEEWHFRTLLTPVAEEVSGAVRPALLVLSGAVALVLLIACANLANLAFSQLLDRRRELAIRAALGAGRSRLIRLLLLESALLAAAGGVLGVAVAAVGLRLLQATAADQVPRLAEAALNLPVLVFALAVSLMAAFLFGLVPAFFASRRAAQDDLRQGITGGRQPWSRSAAVAAQLALTVILVTGTGLVVRSVESLLGTETGFDRRAVLSFNVDLPQAYYPENEAVTAFYDRALAEFRAVPGVRQAGAVRLLPLASTMGDWGITVEGYTPSPGERPAAEWQAASPGYFAALGIPVAEGRGFEAGDDAAAPLVMIVNRAFAERYLPGGGALGTRVRLGRSGERPWTTVVGVVADVAHTGVVDAVKPRWYLPHQQFHLSTGWAPRRQTVVLKTEGDPARVLDPVRRALMEMDPRLALAEVQTMEAVVRGAIAGPRLSSLLLLGFSVLALLLAAVGLYGVMAASVTQRRRELGIRLALGARPLQAFGLVLRQGARIVGLGLLVGVPGALLATRLFESLLFGIGPRDPLTFAVVPVLLAAVGFLAAYLPARRAARVDPRTVLQEE
jgi:putative ABC transport system permease protein